MDEINRLIDDSPFRMAALVRAAAAHTSSASRRDGRVTAT
ncbi:hypothetical protein GGP62_001218 [Salinibacter ruber]|nr:hypothetical protein [Salinibacter ruber]